MHHFWFNFHIYFSAFDLERERNWRQRENKLKVQIAQLEATMKSDLGEKGSIIDRYASERGKHIGRFLFDVYRHDLHVQ